MGRIRPFIIIKSIGLPYAFFLSGSYQHLYQITELLGLNGDFFKCIVLHSMAIEVCTIMFRVKTKIKNFVQEVI